MNPVEKIKILRIGQDHLHYQQERMLRNEVLLRPFGLPDHAWEMKDGIAWHFVAVAGERVVGCVLLTPLDESKTHAQLMQMAVSEDMQKRGVGQQMVRTLVDFARENGVQEIKCHSRMSAVPFYAKLGFEIYGEEFEEVGIRHRYMRFKVK